MFSTRQPLSLLLVGNSEATRRSSKSIPQRSPLWITREPWTLRIFQHFFKDISNERLLAFILAPCSNQLFSGSSWNRVGNTRCYLGVNVIVQVNVNVSREAVTLGEGIAWKAWPQSVSAKAYLPTPSAMLSTIEKDARLSWSTSSPFRLGTGIACNQRR
jgi:hypothetical protein